MTMILRCKQCGQPKPENGWTICGECQAKNIEYEKRCEEYARSVRQEFMRSAPGRCCECLPGGGHRRSEMRGRKARHAVVASHTFEPEEDE